MNSEGLSGSLPSRFVCWNSCPSPEASQLSFPRSPECLLAAEIDAILPSPHSLRTVHSFRPLMFPPRAGSPSPNREDHFQGNVGLQLRPGDQSQRVTAGAVFEVPVGMGVTSAFKPPAKCLGRGLPAFSILNPF